MKRTGSVVLAVSIGFLLACAGLGGGDPLDMPAPTEPLVHDELAWSAWDAKVGKYTVDVTYDDANVVGWRLGDVPAPFEESGSEVVLPFPKGTARLVQLDACHQAGTGPSPGQDGADHAWRAMRTWPPCSADACTYAGLSYSSWRIHAGEYKWSIAFDGDGQAESQWLDEGAPVRASVSGDTVTIPFVEGEVRLQRLDACHWAGTGPHPKEAGITLDYRLNRTWPSCGCD